MIDKDKIFNQDISKYIFYETELGIVLKGDCLEILPLINNFQLLITDPPYEQCFNGGGCLADRYNYRKKEVQKISKFNPLYFLEKILQFKNQGYIWTSKNILDVYITKFKELKISWDILTWNKTNPIPAHNNSYMSDIEFCLFYRFKNQYFNNELKYNDYKKTMLDNVADNNCGHPTQKYQWMIEKFIKISSKENDLILDCYAGSGTTAIACENLNRRYILIEKELEYYNIIKQRIENLPKYQFTGELF